MSSFAIACPTLNIDQARMEIVDLDGAMARIDREIVFDPRTSKEYADELRAWLKNPVPLECRKFFDGYIVLCAEPE